MEWSDQPWHSSRLGGLALALPSPEVPPWRYTVTVGIVAHYYGCLPTTARECSSTRRAFAFSETAQHVLDHLSTPGNCYVLLIRGPFSGGSDSPV